MKRFFMLTVIFIALLQPLVLHGQTSPKENIRLMLAEVNAQMPMSLGSVGVIDSMTLEGDSIVMHMNMDIYDNDAMGYDAPEIQDLSNKVKVGFTNMAQMDKEFGAFLNYLSANGIWLKGDISMGDKSTMFVISPSEQQEILNSKPDYKLFIETNISETKAGLPVDMGVMKMIGYDLIGNDLMTTIEVDESQVNMANMKAGQSEIKGSIIEMLKSGNEPTANLLMINCAKAGYNVVYKYVGNITKEEVVVVITPSEILSSVNQ